MARIRSVVLARVLVGAEARGPVLEVSRCEVAGQDYDRCFLKSTVSALGVGQAAVVQICSRT